MDTLYGWRSREKERAAALEAVVGGRSEGELAVEIETLRKQLRQAQQDVEILQEALFFCQAPETVNPSRKHQFSQVQLDRWPVSAMCRVFHISEQGYYRFLWRPERGQRARQLLEQIYDCLREDEENYRVRRIISWLRLHRGYTGGFWRIYRICQEHHLIIRRQRRLNSLTKADRQAEKSENLINRDFTAAKPNQKFLTDITEIPCTDGKLYLAVLDCFDGSIQGFHMDDNMCAELCVRALENTCRNTRMEGTILHSDWGSRFTSQLFRQALRRCKLVQSMSRTGRCYDNARMESVFATLKKEKLYIMDTTKLPREDVKSLVFRYIHYYNLRRISSVNGGLPPLVLRR